MAGLNDANAAAIAPPATAIVAGTARSFQDATDDCNDTKARKKLKRADDVTVTDNEIAQAVVCETAVAVEVSSDLYADTIAPAWAIPLLSLPAQIACMQAQFTNHAFSGHGGNPENFVLSQPQKKTAGIGAPLPFHPGGTPFPAGAQAPTNRDDIFAMNHAQISALAEWANETFGIVAGDNLTGRRRKLGMFYGV